jgi:hypothetical protein
VPRLTGRIAFLTDGRVLSYAESLMGIVEAEHLGAPWEAHQEMVSHP